ncbi:MULTISPECIES: sporulation peptidase YabG [Bacillus]|uniref:Peptidase n=2 Tax=Bacillus TaxID=1386 RepID=A0A0M3RAI8_9BACI|nr:MULTISPECIES: sporulation peptidase YabG [Bacillus]ALC83262.1 peptidase [Bacillus gobiensis]MBP1084181.1 spore coat assembly protein [Bacillus capparidis]MED1098185.1 sporulation peptidase YabG [Bacillus capparidis]
MQFQIGDLVTRKSYHGDIVFRIISIERLETGKWIAMLHGDEYRLVADAEFTDLQTIKKEEQLVRKRENDLRLSESLDLLKQDYKLSREKHEYQATGRYRHQEHYFSMPGKVLHLDGDSVYLNKCLAVYEKIGVPVFGIHCDEKKMPLIIEGLLDKYRPDILVVTGHDAYSKQKGSIDDINAYRHSKHFVQTVQKARKKIPHLDQLVIFAGACQSHFESLIRAGANFASSPSRVNIHALDPVYIVAKISFTPYREHINVWDVLRNTLTREKGLGGIETKGVLRTGMPLRTNTNASQ